MAYADPTLGLSVCIMRSLYAPVTVVGSSVTPEAVEVGKCIRQWVMRKESAKECIRTQVRQNHFNVNVKSTNSGKCTGNEQGPSQAGPTCRPMNLNRRNIFKPLFDR